MGPSQVSFLLLTIIACSYAMLPNQGSNTASSTASASSSSNTFPNPALFSALQSQNQMSGQGSMQMNQRSSQWPSSNQNNFNTMNRFQTQNPMSYRNPFASQQQYNMRQSYPQNMFRQNSWQYGRQNAQPTYFGQQQQQQQNPWNTFGTQTAAQSRWGQNNIFSSPFNAFTRMRQISTTSQQNQRQQMPMNPFQALGQMRISEQVNNKLISYYKNNYGCVEGIEYVPQMYRPAAISQFASGCGPRANMTCQMTTMRRNPRTQFTYRVMPQSTKDMYEEIINSLDIFTAVDMMRKNGQAVPQSMLTAMSTGGRTTGATANPMMAGASGLLASLTSGGAGASAGMNMGAGAGAGMGMGAGAGAGMGMGAGAGAGMGMGTGASSMAGMGGGSMMGSLGGTLMDLQKIRLTRELAGMELSEAREAIFPFTCSEVGTAVKMGMCCPGAVDLSPQTQMQMMLANTVA